MKSDEEIRLEDAIIESDVFGLSEEDYPTDELEAIWENTSKQDSYLEWLRGIVKENHLSVKEKS